MTPAAADTLRPTRPHRPSRERRPLLTAILPRRFAALVLGLVGAVLLTGCSGGSVAPGGVVEWRELTIDLPAGWVELDRTEASLVVGDGEGSEEPGERGELYVATQLTYEPGASADAWRAFVRQQDAELESDETVAVGSLQGTAIQFSFTTNGIPTRERVVVVPSRDVVLLQQPVPMQGETEGPAWFDEHVDEFDALLEGITFGAPSDFMDQ